MNKIMSYVSNWTQMEVSVIVGSWKVDDNPVPKFLGSEVAVTIVEFHDICKFEIKRMRPTSFQSLNWLTYKERVVCKEVRPPPSSNDYRLVRWTPDQPFPRFFPRNGRRNQCRLLPSWTPTCWWCKTVDWNGKASDTLRSTIILPEHGVGLDDFKFQFLFAATRHRDGRHVLLGFRFNRFRLHVEGLWHLAAQTDLSYRTIQSASSALNTRLFTSLNY